SSYADYRPVLQAASRAFLGKPAFPAGSWDEMSGWLVPDRPGPTNFEPDTVQGTGLLVLRPSNIPTWAYLRAAHFTDRPGHADQLHLDLWWRGWNIAGDAGTILYNASPPWNNALARTAAHNTLVVAGQDQMTHAGRFLWLDRAQAKVLEYQSVPVNNNIWAVAQHDGYRKMGLIHRRKVGWDGTGWLVEDEVFAQAGQPSNRMISVSMHWLLPDCTWQLLTETPLSMRLQTPAGWVNMNIETTAGEELEPGQVSMQLARAGQLVFGDGQVEPTSGWRSHTYGYKEPALSFRYGLRGQLPLRLTTRWDFLPIITPHPPMQAALTN
ncbi:MAG TPA: heparinase II/III-family protein, partial [Anaerolineales bacterium]|nr:heparinase II/III-family protein [Anaerolineales bacterium]